MNRRRFLFGGLAGLLVAPIAVKETLVDVVEVAADYVSSMAKASEFPVYTDIGKYYDDGIAVNDMPGAKRCPAAEINDKSLAFNGDSWFEFYFDNPDYSYTLQQLFRGFNGKKVPVLSANHKGEFVEFDFKKFHAFNKSFRDKSNSVGLWYDGFMSFQDNKTYENIIIPIQQYIIPIIKKL